MPEEKNLAVAAAEGFPVIVSTGAVEIGKGAASAIAAGSVVAHRGIPPRPDKPVVGRALNRGRLPVAP